MTDLKLQKLNNPTCDNSKTSKDAQERQGCARRAASRATLSPVACYGPTEATKSIRKRASSKSEASVISKKCESRHPADPKLHWCRKKRSRSETSAMSKRWKRASSISDIAVMAKQMKANIKQIRNFNNVGWVLCEFWTLTLQEKGHPSNSPLGQVVSSTPE